MPDLILGSALKLFKLAKFAQNFPFSSIIPQQVYRTFKDWMLGLRKNRFLKHRVFNKLGGAFNYILGFMFVSICRNYPNRRRYSCGSIRESCSSVREILDEIHLPPALRWANSFEIHNLCPYTSFFGWKHSDIR